MDEPACASRRRRSRNVTEKQRSHPELSAVPEEEQGCRGRRSTPRFSPPAGHRVVEGAHLLATKRGLPAAHAEPGVVTARQRRPSRGPRASATRAGVAEAGGDLGASAETDDKQCTRVTAAPAVSVSAADRAGRPLDRLVDDRDPGRIHGSGVMSLWRRR